jgi:sortase A
MFLKVSSRNAFLEATSKLRALVSRHASLARLSPALILAGTALLLYVGFQYGHMFAEQHRLAREWEQQNQRGQEAALQPIDDALTKLEIPKIHLEAMVVEGSTQQQLLLGPGHIETTPPPGAPGNSVITAHRDTFFRHIYELNKGDVVEVRRSGKLYTYRVTGKKIVSPEDVSVLRQTNDKRLTLITCYPTYYIGPAPDRLVVFTQLDDRQDALQASKPASGVLGTAAGGTTPAAPKAAAVPQ